jgi:type II secretory pathway component PulM
MTRLSQWLSFSRPDSPSERLALVAGAITLTLVIVWAFVYEPAKRARDQRLARLPQLEQAAREVARLSDEVTERLAKPTPSLPPLAARLETQLRTRAPTGVQLALAGTDRVTVTVDNVSLASLLTWLQQVSTADRLRVEAVTLERLPGDRVRGTVTLVQV